jgi:membrane protease YdiL (CAAX protease family)
VENTTGALRSLRWYAVLALVVFGIVPTVMVALLVAKGRTPGSVGILLIGGIPLILAAAFYAVRGLTGDDAGVAARRLHLSMGLVAGADVLLLGGNALVRMATS